MSRSGLDDRRASWRSVKDSVSEAAANTVTGRAEALAALPELHAARTTVTNADSATLEIHRTCATLDSDSPHLPCVQAQDGADATSGGRREDGGEPIGVRVAQVDEAPSQLDGDVIDDDLLVHDLDDADHGQVAAAVVDDHERSRAHGQEARRRQDDLVGVGAHDRTTDQHIRAQRLEADPDG